MKQAIHHLWTFGIVTAVTVLVWLYAEDANIVEYPGQPVRLSFVVPEGQEGRLNPAGTVTVQIDFDGSNGQYQQFIAQTRGQAIKIPLPLSLNEEYEEADIDVRGVLEEEVFRGLGINIRDVNPSVLTVSFEKYITVPIGKPQQVRSFGINLAEPAVIVESPQIEIRNLPASRRAELEGVTPVVTLRPQDVAGLTKGEQKQIRLPVELSRFVEGVTPSPATVDVIVRLANDTDRVTIERRTIQLTYPPSINQRYIVELDQSTRTINSFELEGPRELIALIKADPVGTPLVWATVRLTNEEVDKAAANGGELRKAVDIMAPPGVVPVSVAERVTVRITPRPGSTAP